MKRTVRLNEQDLRNIVSETVKNVLSELDWRTYDRASKQDYDKKRSAKFAIMRDKAFNDKYGYEDNEKGNYITLCGDLNNPKLEMIVNNRSKNNTHYIKYPKDDKYGFIKQYTSGYDKYPNADSDKRFARKAAVAHDALDDIDAEYKDGKYQDKEERTDFHKFLGKK